MNIGKMNTKEKSLLIEKAQQEIEESSNNKEKRPKIRKKKRQVRKFFLNNGLIRAKKTRWYTSMGNLYNRATKMDNVQISWI